ncbi:MAG: diguanylate cyclase [Firmicutes bacterium]|nr:diguanylate cyclase [Bacillota bacterium]
MLLMPGTPLCEAYNALERLRSQIENEALVLDDTGEAVNITISVGVSCFPVHGATGEGLIAAADAALYRGKAAGRNTVVTA